MLRERLTAEGAHFTSETDAEVVAHLIASHYDGDLIAAVRDAYAELQGHYAFVAMAGDEPDLLVGARKECPLVVGRGEGEQFLASAIPAFLAETRARPADQRRRDRRDHTRGRALLHRRRPADRARDGRGHWDDDTAEKGGYATFMRKEIHEQADAVAETIADRTARRDGVDLGDLGAIDEDIPRAASRRIVVVACGTSYHAGLVGRYAIEEWARVPVEMDIASEYRYRNPVVGPDDLVVGISQSGETADTLAAMRLARERGARVLADHQRDGLAGHARRRRRAVHPRRAWRSAVAATKTFVCQVAAMYLLGLRLAELRGTLAPERIDRARRRAQALPHCIDELIETCERADRRRSPTPLDERDFFLYLGRHVGLPVALEGALKLKEISYIADRRLRGRRDEARPDRAARRVHAGGLRRHRLAGAREGGLQHPGGPRPRRARDRRRDRGQRARSPSTRRRSSTCRATDWMLQPLLAVIPLQLLAYRIARTRGLNVDQPRNLAKTVTVE